MAHANSHYRSRYHPVYGEMQSSSTDPDVANQQLLRELHFARQQRQQQQFTQSQQQPPSSIISSSRTAGDLRQQSPTLVSPGAPRVPYVQPARVNQNQRSSQPSRPTVSSAGSTVGFQQQPFAPLVNQGALRTGYSKPTSINQQPTRLQRASSFSKAPTNIARTQANARQPILQTTHLQGQCLPNLGQTKIECYVCFEDFSPRDTIACQSSIQKHHICKPCAKAYTEAQLGDQKSAIMCGGEKCGAVLPKDPLLALLDAQTIKRWDVLVGQSYLRHLNFQGLAKCPFCEFQAVVPSISEAPLFVCQKGQDGCGKVSCRKCKKEEHPMRKCEEVAGKDSKGKEKSVVEKARQELEEALSEALIQKCSKCGTKFVKEYGCNEMKCPNCRNLQCYICGKDINEEKGDHFGKNRCQMFDNTAKLEDSKVKAAEAAAMKMLLAKYPTLDTSDLKINFSKKVRDAEEQRQKDWEHPEQLIEAGYIEGDIDGEVHTANGIMRNPFTARTHQDHEWDDVVPAANFFGYGNANRAPAANDIEADRRLAEQLMRQDLMDHGWYDEPGPSRSSRSGNGAHAESSRSRQAQNHYGYGAFGYDTYGHYGDDYGLDDGYGWY